jgi:DNA-binding NarL/FixJ family response regulator
MEASPGHNAPIGVLLVDDHAVLLDGLAALIAREPDMEVVGRAASRSEAVQRAESLRPDVALVDLVIPGGGIKAIGELTSVSPGTRPIALTVLDDAAHVHAVRAQGAKGYLVKRAAAREVLQAIRTVHAGGHYFHGPEENRAPAVESARPVARARDITAREAQVLRLLARGFTHKEIGSALGISKKSVDTYRLRIQDKLGCKGRAALVRHALSTGLFGEDENEPPPRNDDVGSN